MAELIGFDTERLRLRRWCPADRESFAALNADGSWSFFLPRWIGPKATRWPTVASLLSPSAWGFWAVETKGNREFIGFAGLHVPGSELPFSPCVEVGWRLAFNIGGRVSRPRRQGVRSASVLNCSVYPKSSPLRPSATRDRVPLWKGFTCGRSARLNIPVSR